MANRQGAPERVNREAAEEDKVFCANCIHCKLLREDSLDGSGYQLRVRCDAGKWKKKLGTEKTYKYFTVSRRSCEECDSYDDMGEMKEFIRELRKDLPIKDETYSN
jgi:hypothetical protein